MRRYWLPDEQGNKNVYETNQNAVIIIGANGYIARNLICVAKEKKNISLMLYGSKQYHIDNETNYKCVDVLDKESVKDIDMDCDVIFMMVGKTGSANGFDNYEEFINYNEIALLNILSEYRNQGSKAKIVFPSTRLVYKGSREPQTEDAEKEFKTIYAINKFACETYLKQYNRVFDVRYCILRICVPYGSLIEGASSYGTAEFMMSKIRNKEDISLFGDGEQRRTLIYIGDLCEIMMQAALSDNCVDDVYNIGGEDYSLKEMAELISASSNSGVAYQEWPEIAQKIESGNTVFNADKLEKKIDIKYKVQFKDWVKQNGTSF